MKINSRATLMAVWFITASATTIVFAEPVTKPEHETMTVAQARTLPLGSTVTIADALVTNTVDLINDDAKRIFQIQDATGGLCVFGMNEEIEPLLGQFQTGDVITIRGVVEEYQGLFELVAPLEVVAVEHRMPVAIPVTPGELQNDQPDAEALESRLVQLNNVRFVDIKPGDRFQAAHHYPVTDGQHTATVKVRSRDVALFDKPIPTEPVNIRGLVLQWGESKDPNEESTYHVHMRFADDIKLVEPIQATDSE